MTSASMATTAATKAKSVTVLGAGVIGLSVAWRLAQAGHRVRVLAAEPPALTTSAVAAALWYPYRAYPQDLVTRWSGLTYQALADLAGRPGSGVRMRAGRELFRSATPDPWWATAVPGLARVPVAELPGGFADGLRLTVPVVDMPVHLGWLCRQLAEYRVVLRIARVRHLDEVPDPGDVLVNCTGLGARALLPDPSLVAVRGQVVVVDQVGLDEWTLDDQDEPRLTYVIPRESSIVLGGTADEGDEDLVARPAIAEAIVARCAALVPQVARARIRHHRVGLRPGRPAVRLEPEPGRPVIHCYGHGGAGVTMALGCAIDVARLVDAI